MTHRDLWRAGAWLSLPVGAAVFAKALATPLFGDDLLQRAMALGAYPVPRGALDLYDFVRPGERAGLVASGALPWWAADDLSVRFFRPLASAMLYVEHRFVASPIWMHVHSFVWWAAAVIATAWLFRSVLGDRAAAIATWIFALAPCHVLPLVVLAQREVLVATTFGVLGIVYSVRSKGASRLASAAFFAASLCAGEYALCFGGYVVAWALTRSGARERVRATLPFVVPAVIYLALRAALGYGAVGTGFYRDPFHSPRQFFLHAPRSLLVLWSDAWTSLDASLWPLIALIVSGAALLAFVRLVPQPVRWLAGGSLLSALPLLASTPGQRLTGPLLVGAAGAFGWVVERALAKPVRLRLASAVALAIVVEGAFAARSSFRETEYYRARGQSVRSREASLADELRRHDPATVVVALASWESAFFGLVLASTSTPPRVPWRVLVTARHALVLRVDDRTADVIVPKGQGFFPLGADDIFRSEDDPLHVGDVRTVPGMRAEVLSDGTAAPPRVRFSFDRSLDAPSFLFLSESRASYRVFSPPARGFGMPLSP
ncbi:MAG TPA: hypothetical protein VGH28_30600 [Polyangiaceae bacterium]